MQSTLPLKRSVNFAHLLDILGQEHVIPTPHNFLAYFYYPLNMETQRYDAVDIMDSLSTTILTMSCFSEVDITFNPQLYSGM